MLQETDSGGGACCSRATCGACGTRGTAVAREWKRANRRRDAGGGTLKGGEKGEERKNFTDLGLETWNGSFLEKNPRNTKYN
jgi:hypothetical protein